MLFDLVKWKSQAALLQNSTRAISDPKEITDTEQG